MLNVFRGYNKVRTSDCKCAKCLKGWSKEELEEQTANYWFKTNNKKELSKSEKFIILEVTNKTRTVTVPKIRYEYEISDIESVWMKVGYDKYKWIQFPKYSRNAIEDGTQQITEYLVRTVEISDVCTKNE